MNVSSKVVPGYARLRFHWSTSFDCWCGICHTSSFLCHSEASVHCSGSLCLSL